MTTIRKLCCNDLLGFTSVNLDHLTITNDMSFYLKWLINWSKYTHVAVAPGNRIMGYILGAAKEDVKGVHWYGAVMEVSVASEYRRQKLATKFMGLFEKQLVEKMHLSSSRDDHYNIILYLGVFNTPAQRFFTKIGYKVVTTIPEFFSENGEDAYEMDKEIAEEGLSRGVRFTELCSSCVEAKRKTCSYVCLPYIV